jgi:hypothetical protein
MDLVMPTALCERNEVALDPAKASAVVALMAQALIAVVRGVEHAAEEGDDER